MVVLEKGVINNSFSLLFVKFSFNKEGALNEPFPNMIQRSLRRVSAHNIIPIFQEIEIFLSLRIRPNIPQSFQLLKYKRKHLRQKLIPNIKLHGLHILNPKLMPLPNQPRNNLLQPIRPARRNLMQRTTIFVLIGSELVITHCHVTF